MKFPKKRRLLKRGQFKSFDKNARQYRGAFLVLAAKKNKAEEPRLGITATRRFGKAVQRNKFKRLVREAFRALLPQLPSGYDYLIKPRFAALHVSFDELKMEFLQLVKHAVKPK